MRTSRALSVSPSMLCAGGVPGVGSVPSPRGVYLVQGDVPGSGGVCSRGSAPGGCTWSQGGVCSWEGVPGPRGVYLVPGLYLVPGGCTWSWGGLLQCGAPGPGGVCSRGGTWSRRVYLPRYSPCEQNS